MVTFVEKKKEIDMSRADMVFFKHKDFEKTSWRFTYPKISGRWVIFHLGCNRFEQILDIMNMFSTGFADVTVFTSKELLKLVAKEFPDAKTTEISTEEEFRVIVRNSGLLFTDKVASELVYRVKGDREMLYDSLVELKSVVPKGEVVGKKELNKVLLRDDRVFARDVLISALGLSFYPTDTFKLLDKLVEGIGKDVAYYALRKYCKRLLDDKMKVLRGKKVDNTTTIDKVSSNLLAYACTCIELGNPNTLYLQMQQIIDRRYRNNELLSAVIEDNFDEYYSLI